MLPSASAEVEQVTSLFWMMTLGSAVIWLLLILIAGYAALARTRGERAARLLVLVGGVAVPTVVLAGLLAYGLELIPQQNISPAARRIVVTGERWWWRVQYDDVDGRQIVLANELRLPVAQPVVLELRSNEVIHSLWVPALAGKRDLIPGRVNHLRIEPTRVGVYSGVCAEFCGTGHAHMRLVVEVMSQDGFASWLEAQRAPARPPVSDEARRGAELFAARGCANCHTVRGTGAQGRVGPDLTHVGSRHSIGAGSLPVSHETLRQWISYAATIKPRVLMPSYSLPRHELDALASYVEQLE
jgi:cytochrome c oxidase subunit 2